MCPARTVAVARHRIEADAVVAHARRDRHRRRARNCTRDVRGPRVAHDVREQLARAAQDGAVVGRRLALVEVELEREPGALGGRARGLPERRRQPRLLEQVRVQVGDRAAQLRDRRGDRRVRPRLGAVGRRRGRRHRGRGGPRAGSGSAPSWRSWASTLRSRSSAVSASATRRWRWAESRPQRAVAAREQQREQREREAEPGDVGRLHEHERERAAARAARVRRATAPRRRSSPPRPRPPSAAAGRGTRPPRPGRGTRSAAARTRRPSCR